MNKLRFACQHSSWACIISVGVLLSGCGDDGVTPGTTRDASLNFDSELCRNDGQIAQGSTVWLLADPVPFAWRNESPKHGQLHVIDDSNAEFTSGDTVLKMAFERLDECHGWEGD